MAFGKKVFETKRAFVKRRAMTLSRRSRTRLAPVSKKIGKRLIKVPLAIPTRKMRKRKQRVIGRRIRFTSISRKKSRRGSALRNFV